jgi:sulfatase modifying factor 1
MLVAGSSVFVSPGRPVDVPEAYNWWSWVPGADWCHPQGPDSSIRNKPDHNVVHAAWADVEGYAQWVGKKCRPRPSGSSLRRGGRVGPHQFPNQ